MSKSENSYRIIDDKLNDLRCRWSRFIFMNGVVRALMLVLLTGFIDRISDCDG